MTRLRTRHGPLWVHDFGDGPTRAVALHGFTLSGASFARLASISNVRLLAPDLPGHGRSRIEPVTMDTATAAVAALLSGVSQPPLLLGYSQGGRVALQIALDYPELVGSLLLVSSSPGLPEPERTARREADEALATRIERIGTERFIDDWLANPITSTGALPEEQQAADRAIRMENDATGLAAALRGLGQAAIDDRRDMMSTLAMPMRFVAGERDEKYADAAREMATLSGGEAVIIAGAGHNVIIDKPEAIAAQVRGLLSRESY